MNTTSTFDAWLSEKEALVQKVKSEMGEHRFTHTLAVAKESIILATAFDFSEQDAKRLFIASLLHDYTKAYSTEKQIALAKEYGITLTQDDLASPPVLHSRTAAGICQIVFPGDVDCEIAEAIRCHTVGKKEMSLFDKLLFLADYIEETRTYPDCIALRRSFWEAVPTLSPDRLERHLSATLLHAVDYTIGALCREGLAIAPATVAAHNLLIAEINSDIS